MLKNEDHVKDQGLRVKERGLGGRRGRPRKPGVQRRYGVAGDYQKRRKLGVTQTTNDMGKMVVFAGRKKKNLREYGRLRRNSPYEKHGVATLHIGCDRATSTKKGAGVLGRGGRGEGEGEEGRVE